jgi:RNA polymerase sigma-70 factor (ECF subfamily)
MGATPLTSYVQNRGLEATARGRLLSDARRGNREAFTEMMAPYVPALSRRTWGLTGNAMDAEDASQDTLLKVWSRLEQFTGKADASADEFRAWISRIATNSSIDLLRQRRDGKFLSLEDPKGANDETLGSGIPAVQQDPEERCARREMGRLLAGAILQLPPDLRQACLLRDVLHYSTQEVAERLGISIVAVRLRLFRARRRLREKLEEPLRRPRQASVLLSSHRETRAARTTRNHFVPLGAAASFASGD